MSFKIHGTGRGGPGYGSSPMSRRELAADIDYWLDQLRRGEFAGNRFTVEWDQSDEPHVFTRDALLSDADVSVCKVCQDTEAGNPVHVAERRVTGAARRRR